MTRPTPRLLLLAACVLALLVLAAPAAASTRSKIIADCADDGQLQGSYSPAALRDARQHLPSDVAEYTDCIDVLRRAELPERGGGHGSGSGSSGSGSGAAAAAGSGGALITPASPEDHEALREAASTGDRPVRVSGQTVVPGASGLSPSAKRNELPGTLIAALVLLGLAGGALTIPAVRRNLPQIGRRR